MKKLIYIILILICGDTYSQSIVNTEKAMIGDDNKPHLSSDFSTNMSRGNVDITMFNGDINLGIRLDTNNIIRLISGINILSQSGTILNNVGFSQLRHNFNINDRIKTFSFIQSQYNNVLLLNRRHLIGSGIRLDLSKAKSNFSYSVLIGAMYEYEKLDTKQLYSDEIYKTEYIRSSTSLSLKYDNKKINIISTTYYQVYFLNLKDFRILNDTEFRMKISKRISVFNVFEYRYDSNPPKALNRFDFTNSAGFSINI